MMSPIIIYVYKIMFSCDPLHKIVESYGVLNWDNGKGVPVYGCHKDKGVFLQYWNYKDK